MQAQAHERGKSAQFQREKSLKAQRPRTYTYPTRPIKQLGRWGRRMHNHNTPPPGRPLWFTFTLRSSFMPPGE